MNFLKSVFGVGKPSEQQQLSNQYAEFLTFQLGCRYFDYNLLSGSKICQCIDGTASFDVKFQGQGGEKEFSILIKNNLHDDDQDNANIMLFPLNESVSIKRYKYDQNDDEGVQQGFALQYTSRDDIKFLIEFHSSIPQQFVDQFHDKICCLLFEQLQGNKPSEGDKMSCQQLVLFSDYYKNIVAPAPSPSFGGNQYQQQEEEQKFSKSSKPKFSKPSGISLSIEENQPKFPSFPTLFSGAGSLYLFDRSNNSNTLAQNSVVFTVLERTDFSDKKNPKYCYGIGVFDGDESITIADFNQDTHLSLSPYQNSIFWVSYDLVADVINSWVFRFQNEGVIFKLKSIFARCNLQLQRQQDYDKAVKEQDREWIENSYCNMRDVDSLEPDEQMDIQDMQFEEPASDQEEDDDEKNVPGGLKFIKPYENQDPNKHRETIQAGSYNRTFTVRGKDVSVYRQGGSKGAVQGNDDGLEHVSTFNQIIKKHSDKSIVPRQMMFHGNEKRMIFLDQNEKNKMFCMDLQTAKVVDEWKTNKDQQNDIVQLTNAHKNAQLQNIDQFVGVGNNVVQMYDPRLNSQFKMCNERPYKTNPKFSCVVTTKTGELATGSETGEIKLYSKVGQIAKTALPGLGDPIRHIDSTHDGLWVLATCDKYLLVIPTYMQNTSKKNYGDSNGFKMRMGKDKPSPLKLTLKPRDIAYYGIKTVKFSGAKFNTSKESGQESSISTSTGEFLITWSFSKVQKGILQDYKIKPMRDSVCENQFKFGTDQSIVVTFPEKLQMQKRRKI